MFSSAANGTKPLTSPVRNGVKRVSRKDDDVALASDLQFETPLKIVEYPDPILQAKNKRIGIFDENLKNLVDAMFDVMYNDHNLKIDARDITGERFSISLSLLPARIFQHEYDHLEGVLFFERMTDQVLDNIRGELEDLTWYRSTSDGVMQIFQTGCTVETQII